MSETIERNDAGQFAIDTSTMVGLELEQAQAGFRTRPRDPDPEGVDLKAAAADLVAKRAQPLEIQPDDVKAALGGPDVTEAVTPEQAAQDIASRRQETTKFIDGYNIERVADDIDAKRAEQLKANPRAADELGLTAQDVEAAKKADLPDTAKADPLAIRADNDPTAAAIDQMDGLDPETRQALKNPQVRQALEQEFTKVEQAQRGYSEALSHANTFSHAAILAIAPELQSVPLDRWQEGIAILAQADPARGQQLGSLLGYVGQVQSAQAQWQQQQAQVQHQQFEATVVSEDARLTEMFGGDKSAADAANSATIAYLADHGIPRHQMLQIFKTNPVLSTAEARRTIWEAAEYRRITSAPKAVPQALPTVQRPGVQRDGPRPGDNSSKIQSLQRQLAGANGATAVRIAGQIRSLKRG